MTTRTPPRRRPVALVLLPAALALTACSGSAVDDTGPADPAEPAGTASASAPAPADADTTSAAPDAGLEHYYAQELTFEACDDYAMTAADAELFSAVDRVKCARLEVPVDYAEPGGETAEIAVSRLPARGESIGSLFLNPGGPGGPALGAAVLTAAAWDGTAIPERFDVVGFDPRGVGASVPAIDCVSDEQADAGEQTFPQAAIQGTWTEEDTRAVAEQCIERTGSEDFLAHIGTRDVARDMDVLRAVLDEDQVSFVGQSYGTRLGAVYAEMFPERVRAMVLDGAVDPTLGTHERRLTQYAGFQRSFEQMAGSCAEEDGCVLGPDPEEATERFQDVVRPLIEEPVPAGDGRELDYNGAVGGVISGLYDAEAWPTVLAGIAELEQGRGDTLLTLGDSFGQREESGVWTNYLEANHVINCLDEERATAEEEVAQRAAIHEAAPFMDPGEGPEGARDLCEAWPGEPTLGYPYAQGVEGLPQTLVISITGDPSTPYDGGVALAETLDSALLSVEGEQHTVAMGGTSDCVNEIVAGYLLEPEAASGDTTCTL